jgi:hypothetical protein
MRGTGTGGTGLVTRTSGQVRGGGTGRTGLWRLEAVIAIEITVLFDFFSTFVKISKNLFLLCHYGVLHVQ